jgi:hypothetical protein
MKTIHPLDIWKDGATQTATCLKLYISYDDLETKAALIYQLCDVNDVVIYEGQIFISGQTYLDWGASGDSNEEAYFIAATQLNLSIL